MKNLFGKVFPKNPEVYKGLISKKDWNGYGFKLEEVEEIKEIPIKGKLGLWNYEGEI